MKPVIAVLCLLVTVRPSAGQPAGAASGAPPQSAAPRLRDVRFEGDPALEPGALKRELKALRIRRVIPGIWTRRPVYDARAVEADLARLRSFYFSRGHFDARVAVGGVTVDGDGAVVTLEVQPGPKYAVRVVEIDGIPGEPGHALTAPRSEFPADALCSCLLGARRLAETHGHVDVAGAVAVAPVDAPLSDRDRAWVDVAARVGMGPSYAVGRIQFSGHRRISDSTLRRALGLPERSLFDAGRLRAALARLNRSGLIEPLALDDVAIERHPETLTVDLTIAIRERRPRTWSLSGPIGPSALGLLEANLSSRLPPWGRGIFEASTYSLTLTLTGFSNPLIRLLPIRVRRGPPALLTLERPYLPGQAL